mmetsp:Transcript_18276/g.1605  ORF Transcript_18276/g.1605 Transcript_18276/m.1605 type:complete len:83 (+) Transcript_18276:1437-1685(+)
MPWYLWLMIIFIEWILHLRWLLRILLIIIWRLIHISWGLWGLIHIAGGLRWQVWVLLHFCITHFLDKCSKITIYIIKKILCG